MNRMKEKTAKLLQRVVDWTSGNGLMQQEISASGSDVVSPEMAALIRRTAAEGCVLLKNDGTLPLKKDEKVAVFGRCQLDWFYVGYGSGGDVHPPYRANLMEGLSNAGVAYDREVAELYKTWCSTEENQASHGWWGHWPMSHPEMLLGKTTITNAAVR